MAGLNTILMPHTVRVFMFARGSSRVVWRCIGARVGGSFLKRMGNWLMFSPGEDVVVVFDGEEYPGEVIEHRHGRVLARALIDPNADHGVVSSMLGLPSIVNVCETDVRLAETG